MSTCHLFVCERTSRWASALRLAIERESAGVDSEFRLRETRRLGELTSELAEYPASLIAVEVHETNFADVLAWLNDTERSYPRARLVALLDRSLSAIGPSVHRNGDHLLRDVCDALREAGAADVVESPRRLEPLLALARCHAGIIAADQENQADRLPFTAQVWASLPWQDA